MMPKITFKNDNWIQYPFQLTVGIVLFVLILLPGVLKAEGYDSISVIEYYFDQDPGVGNGVILVSDSTPAYVADEVIDISSLSEGIHTIWFRTQDNNGLWAAPTGKSFYVYRTLETDSVNVPVKELEYAFDNNAFAPLGKIPQDTSVSLATNLDMAGLSDPGIHTIWFRAKDTHPHVSAIASRSFFVYHTLETDSVNVPVEELEYAFDNNEFATLGEITQDTSVSLTTNLDVTGLSDPGIHTVWFRAKDTHPHISAMTSRSFFVYRTLETDSVNVPVEELEYAFDSNEFASLGEITQDTSVSLATNLDVADLSDPGIHTVWFRAKDTHPHISAMTSRSFFVYHTLETDSINVPIEELEYAFDNNEFATLGEITQDTSVSLATNLDVAGLSDPGIHTVWFRAKDTHPHISAMTSRSFFVYQKTLADSSNVPVTAIEYSLDSITAFFPLVPGAPDTSVTVTDNLDIARLIGHGEHTVTMRAKDEQDFWGNAISVVFSVENEYPIANAGNDMYAGDNTEVTLDATASLDLNNDELEYYWESPPEIVLNTNNGAMPTFTAPSILADTSLVFVLYVNDGLVDSPRDTLIVRVIHNTIDICDTIIETGTNECVNAFHTITIAGDGSTVTFENGSSIALIAGQLIRFLPGFHAMRGSDMVAYIEDGNGFCDKAYGGILAYQPPVEKSMVSEFDNKNSPESISKQAKIYPNPSDGHIVIQLKNYEGTSKITVVNSLGVTMYRAEIIENDIAQLDLSHLNNGVYFVQIRNQKDIKTKKLIIR